MYDVGWYYLNNRYYDPRQGRFINCDEVKYIGQDGTNVSYNLYAYCLNNPVNRFDDGGNLSLPNWAKLAIGVGAIAVGTAITVITGGTSQVVAATLFAGIKAACTAGLISAGSKSATTALISALSGNSFSTVVNEMLKGGSRWICQRIYDWWNNGWCFTGA